MKLIFALQVATYTVLTLLFGHLKETIDIIVVLGINYLVLHFAGFKLVNTKKGSGTKCTH